jgi:methionyl aminopeptidase
MHIQQASTLQRSEHDQLVGRDRALATDRGAAVPQQPAFTQVARDKRRIYLRSRDEVGMIARAGRVVSTAIDAAADLCRPGVTTREINGAAADEIRSAGGRSLFLNYPSYKTGEGFPACTCISVNEEVVHGIPGSRTLVQDDIVTIDCGVELGGWCADAARTVVVGAASRDVMNVLAAAEAMLELAIELAHPGRWWSRIADRLQQVADDGGYGVVREYVGHGIGRQLHEAPQVPAYRMSSRDKDFQLRPGMVIAVEPMVTIGAPATRVLEDGWTVVTSDGRPACHVEHTIAITEHGPTVLTAPSRKVGG